MTGNVYAILGGRGGVGATTTAVALGASLAETAHRVAVIDADFDGAGVDAALGLGEPDRGLRDVLRGDADLADALVETHHGVQVLPGDGAPAPTDVRSHALVRAADRVRERFDVVLVDLGAAGGTATAFALERVDGAILAATPEDDAIAAVADAAAAARYHGADVLGTAFTRIPKGTEIDPEEAAEALGTDVLALVPEDDAVAESAAAGTSLLRHDPDSPAAMVYWDLAGRLADGDLGGEPVVHEPPTAGSAERDSAAPEPQTRERADAAEDSAVEISPEPGSRAKETDGAEGSASQAQPDAEARCASRPRSQAREDAGGREASSESSVANAPEDADEHSSSIPRSTTSPEDADERSSSSPDSASPRRDAEAQRASSPRSTTPPEDTDEQSSSSPAPTTSRRTGDAQTPSAPDSRGGADAGTAADGSASDRAVSASDEVAAPADPETGDGDETSANEFSWGDDSIEDDETVDENGPLLDHGSSLTDENEATVTETDDESEDDGSDVDEVEAAFKATMDRVREQRKEEEETDDEDDGGMFGFGG